MSLSFNIIILLQWKGGKCGGVWANAFDLFRPLTISSRIALFRLSRRCRTRAWFLRCAAIRSRAERRKGAHSLLGRGILAVTLMLVRFDFEAGDEGGEHARPSFIAHQR